ncbi:LOW QUALITY PROTEIN: hypothetical protein ACHAW6_003085 [Cyclotella cf. meneghiniana]
MKLDIRMQYYKFELEEYTQDLCSFITHFGKYKLQMGLECSPNISPSIMESVLAGIDDADVYTNDASGLSQTWDHYIKLLGELHCIHENGFTINPLKCEN